MLINLTNVSYGYDDTLVFYGVNATVNEGDRIGLVGINGAGKTTLINVLLKNLECVDGDVFHKSNLRVGYLAQNSLVYHRVYRQGYLYPYPLSTIQRREQRLRQHSRQPAECDHTSRSI